MKPRRILLVTYEGAELLDIAGPSAVFTFANRVADRPLYEVQVVSPDAPQVAQSGGLAVAARPLSAVRPGARDTVLVVGGEAGPIARVAAHPGLLSFLGAASRAAERWGSICAGTFILAAAGLLEGRRCATHWEAVERLRRFAPLAEIDGQALYVRDGPLWTSAGVTTGIDMALALLATDHGHVLKSKVARRMVLHAHRPGHQSQFSELLALQSSAGARFAPLMDWLSRRLHLPTGVEEMAERAGMSPRTFQRRFRSETGETPARAFDRLRLDHARSCLEAGQPIAGVAGQCGFRSEAAFRTAFRHQFGVPPALFRGQTVANAPDGQNQRKALLNNRAAY